MAFSAGTPLAMGVRDKDKPADAKINVKGDAKKPATPSSWVCPSPAASKNLSPLPKTERRLELARWLTRPDHPLTARVAANRVWQHLFGEGIVATPTTSESTRCRRIHNCSITWNAFRRGRLTINDWIRAITLS